MSAFTIPVHFVIDAPTLETAVAQAQKAQQLLNEPFTKAMINGQGVALKSAKVGYPVAGTS